MAEKPDCKICELSKYHDDICCNLGQRACCYGCSEINCPANPESKDFHVNPFNFPPLKQSD